VPTVAFGEGGPIGTLDHVIRLRREAPSRYIDIDAPQPNS